MTEQLDLAVATPATPGRASYIVNILILDREGQRVEIRLRADNGERQQFVYDGAIAMTLMNALNKADLSVKSLHRRILEKLTADGKLDGAISGVPD